MFLPNTSSEKAKISYEYRNYKETNLITVKGKVKESLASGDYVLELEGWPLLGDVESTPIIFDSLRWFSTKYPAELIDTKIYSNGNLTILCCGNKQIKRLIDKVGAATIIKISPMPIAEGKIKIDIESFVKEQQNIVLNIYNSLGEKVGLIYEGTLSSGISSMEVNLPEAIRSGMYQVVINGTNSAYPIFITK